MRKDTRAIVVVVAFLALIIVGGNLAVRELSGVDPPFTVVESQSMQHGRGSEIGVIDTGDMILVKNPSSAEIVSYIEGYHTGYTSFGEYGSVIIYERPYKNPVIHRAILWLESNGDGTWSAPALEYYNDGGTRLWECASNDYNNLSGTLVLNAVGYMSKEVSVNLDGLDNGISGYLTMGDNAETNTNFDQSVGIYSELVSEDIIKSVAWKEIPWIGTIKLMMKGNTSSLESWAPNSIGLLALSFTTFVLVLLALGYLSDSFGIKKAKKGRARCSEFKK